MHMSEENWKEAQTEFFESFRNYDAAGSLQRIQVLKYLVLTTMLMKSDINPFESQETKPYKNDPRISAMTDLVDAYQQNDIHRYESILRNNKDVLADPFIAENIDEVTRSLRSIGVLKLITPYTRFTLSFIANQLKISVMEVQDILGFLILDKKIDGKINQQKGTVEIDFRSNVDRTHAMQGWSSAIGSLCRTILDEGDGFKTDESQSQSLGSAMSGLLFTGETWSVGTRGGGGATSGLGKAKSGGKKGGGFGGRIPQIQIPSIVEKKLQKLQHNRGSLAYHSA